MRKEWTWAKKFLGDATATCGTLWLLLEPLGMWVEDAKPTGIEAYVAFIAIGLGVAWWINRPKKSITEPKKSITMKIRGTGSKVTVEVGDIFEGGGLKFIPVNEYFDHELGDPVSETSLHGQFIKEIIKGEGNWQQKVTSELQKIDPIERDVERNSGETDRYEIGTTVRIKAGGPGQEYMLVAFGRTNIKTSKAEPKLEDLYTCLDKICEEARNYNLGKQVDIPVIGSGFANLDLSAQQILDILILFVMYHSQKRKIAKHIRIVIGKDLLKELDLHETERIWKQ